MSTAFTLSDDQARDELSQLLDNINNLSISAPAKKKSQHRRRKQYRKTRGRDKLGNRSAADKAVDLDQIWKIYDMEMKSKRDVASLADAFGKMGTK